MNDNLIAALRVMEQMARCSRQSNQAAHRGQMETGMSKQERITEAKRLIERDDELVYDACANAGQIVNNLPERALLRIVVAFLEGN